MNATPTVVPKGIALIPLTMSLLITAIIITGAWISFKPSTKQIALNEAILHPNQHERELSDMIGQSSLLTAQRAYSQPNTDIVVQGMYQKLIPDQSILLSITNDDSHPSDILSIQVRGNSLGTILNCQGHPLAFNQTSQEKIYVNKKNQLVCEAINDSSQPSQAYVLIENIEAMHTSLGMDINGDHKVDFYNDPNAVGQDFSKVLSLRISFLIKTEKSQNNVIEKKFYNLQNKEVGPFEDGKLRKIYTETSQLTTSDS